MSCQEISRPSRAVMAKKCTKKCNVRAELLFCLLSLLLFFTFSFLLPLLLLNLLIMGWMCMVFTWAKGKWLSQISKMADTYEVTLLLLHFILMPHCHGIKECHT